MTPARDQEKVGIAFALGVRVGQVKRVQLEANLANVVVESIYHEIANALIRRRVHEDGSIFAGRSAALKAKEATNAEAAGANSVGDAVSCGAVGGRVTSAVAAAARSGALVVVEADHREEAEN